MVAATGSREVASDTLLVLRPAAPLRPGASYRLRVDGAATRELHEPKGTLRAPLELVVMAAGAPAAQRSGGRRRP
jgi:hypothetical protein